MHYNVPQKTLFLNEFYSPSSSHRKVHLKRRLVLQKDRGETEKEKERMGKFKRVCVFCGSHSGKRTVYSDAASELGNELVRRKIDLVYGGGSVGLMGLISKTLYNGGCHVRGVIPAALVPTEISGHAVGEVMIVPDMHQRKAEMARQADAFIALPGGYGTLEELLEIITWSQLGFHDKPVGLLNVDGYYDCLLALFDTGVEEGFIKPSSRDIVISAATPQELIQMMEDYAPTQQQVAATNHWNKDAPVIIPNP